MLTHLSKIAQAADETVRALEEIVWAVRPGSDSLQSLVEYIAHFSSELFEGDGTRCRLDLPHDLPQLSLPPELRHNIFLVVKEALTNVIKHAQAKEVHVQAKATAGALEFVVQDDGQGFEPGENAHESQHNGLSNMQRRAATMGGQLTVESTKTGTAVRLVVPIAAAANQEKTERSS
jgi:signal transduction histidine kinase